MCVRVCVGRQDVLDYGKAAFLAAPPFTARRMSAMCPRSARHPMGNRSSAYAPEKGPKLSKSVFGQWLPNHEGLAGEWMPRHKAQKSTPRVFRAFTHSAD